jgi:cytidylate kinase
MLSRTESHGRSAKFWNTTARSCPGPRTGLPCTSSSLKVFLTAEARVRAERRAAEMGAPDRLDEYLAEIERRDAADSGRAIAPLRQAEGALVLDTGRLSVDECVDAIVARLGEIGA